MNLFLTVKINQKYYLAQQ